MRWKHDRCEVGKPKKKKSTKFYFSVLLYYALWSFFLFFLNFGFCVIGRGWWPIFLVSLGLHVAWSFTLLTYIITSLNPLPNAEVCVYLTVHITKLQLQTTFPKPLYIRHSACIHGDPGRWKSWCLHCLWPVR